MPISSVPCGGGLAGAMILPANVRLLVGTVRGSLQVAAVFCNFSTASGLWIDVFDHLFQFQLESDFLGIAHEIEAIR